ncbi:hypothetical protein C8F01DRAFT_1251531 [Mycena amicta]|nr:hypothetical protein C8F01DRAFT_1251531 [Mycena amicta]
MVKATLIISLLSAFFLPRSFGTPSPVASVEHTYEKRDILAFYATQNWLQFMANLFAQNAFYSVGQGVAQLQASSIHSLKSQIETHLVSSCSKNIANHLKNCSDAFDSANIAIASMVPPGQFSPVFDPADIITTDERFVPSTQNTIITSLSTLLSGKAFFEAVKASGQMQRVLCHWVGDLARENDIFLNAMIQAASSVKYDHLRGMESIKNVQRD